MIEEGKKIETEPRTREVRIDQRGALLVAVTAVEGPRLTGKAVEEVRRAIRQRYRPSVPSRRKLPVSGAAREGAPHGALGYDPSEP